VSVHLIDQQQQQRAAGLLRAGDIDRYLRAPAPRANYRPAAGPRSAGNAGSVM